MRIDLNEMYEPVVKQGVGRISKLSQPNQGVDSVDVFLELLAIVSTPHNEKELVMYKTGRPIPRRVWPLKMVPWLSQDE